MSKEDFDINTVLVMPALTDRELFVTHMKHFLKSSDIDSLKNLLNFRIKSGESEYTFLYYILCMAEKLTIEDLFDLILAQPRRELLANELSSTDAAKPTILNALLENKITKKRFTILASIIEKALGLIALKNIFGQTSRKKLITAFRKNKILDLRDADNFSIVLQLSPVGLQIHPAEIKSRRSLPPRIKKFLTLQETVNQLGQQYVGFITTPFNIFTALPIELQASIWNFLIPQPSLYPKIPNFSSVILTSIHYAAQFYLDTKHEGPLTWRYENTIIAMATSITRQVCDQFDEAHDPVQTGRDMLTSTDAIQQSLLTSLMDHPYFFKILFPTWQERIQIKSKINSSGDEKTQKNKSTSELQTFQKKFHFLTLPGAEQKLAQKSNLIAKILVTILLDNLRPKAAENYSEWCQTAVDTALSNPDTALGNPQRLVGKPPPTVRIVPATTSPDITLSLNPRRRY